MRNDNKSWKQGVQRVGKQLGGALAGGLGAVARPVRGLYKKGKKSAVDILDKSKKQLQEVMDRGSYSLKDAPTREFLRKQREKTVKKILKINKPK